MASERDWSVGWAFPGHGEASESCGKVIYLGHKAGDGSSHWRASKRRCGRFACPVCALEPGGWAHREAGAVVHRIRGGLSVVRRLAVHWVISPPPKSDFSSTSAYRRLRSRAYAIALEQGFRGGCAVFHAKRTGAARFNHGRSLGCRVGPHFHLIGDGWHTAPEPRPAPCDHHGEGKECFPCEKARLAWEKANPGASEGWVVKNLGIRRSISGTAFYLLTHAAQATFGKDAVLLAERLATEGILPTPDLRPPEVVTWFGSMAYNRLKVPPPEPSEIVCPVCEAEIPFRDWFSLSWIGQGPPPEGGNGVCRNEEWSVSYREFDRDEWMAWDTGGQREPSRHTRTRGLA